MRENLRITAICIVGLFAALHWVAGAPEKEAAADLWQRSLRAIETSKLQFPEGAHYESYTLDNSGKALRSLEVNVSMNWNQFQAGLESASLLKSSGQKPSKSKKETWLLEVEKWISHLDLALPFFMEASPLMLKEAPNRKIVEGVDCRGFEFQIDALGYPLRGTSWVDPETGLPKQVDMRITNLEYESEDKKVIHFYRTLNFASEEKAWIPITMTESIWFVQRSLLKGELFVEEHSVRFE